MTKHRKNRGSRTCSKGGIQPGGRGGKGNSGSKSHRRSWYNNNAKDHFGKRGFIHRNAKTVKTINLRILETVVGDKKEITVSDFGYDKVLGSGTFSKKVTVKANYFSKSAKEKIEKAGGKAVELIGSAETFEKETVESE